MHSFPQFVCTAETLSVKSMEENYRNISTLSEGVEPVVGQRVGVKDLEIKQLRRCLDILTYCQHATLQVS